MRFLNNILAKAGLIVDGVTQLNTIANATIDTDKFLVSDGGVVKYRTGAELASDIGPGNLSVSTVKHIVKLGEAVAKGQAVYVSSADGTNMIVSKASNASEATSSKTFGLLETGGILNDQVYVVTEGLLAGLDTSTANAGDPVWLGTNGNLIFGLLNKPYAPAHLVFIGIVTRVQQNNGEIFVKVQNGFELKEIHDVQITTTPADNSVLSYENSSSLYKMKSIATLLGYTPANAARQLTINGTTYDLTADRIWSVGTVTSVGVSVPTGLSVSNTPVTGSGTIAIAFTAGYSIPTTASQANWDTAYNNRITSLTTTGTSGAATLVSNTLNIPQYQAQGNYITSLTGEATASGPGAASVTLTNSAVIGKVLTGLNVTGGSIAAADSILTAFGKLQNQVNGLAGGVTYQGAWDASTNSPSLTSSVGTKGYYYVVSVAGSTNLNGITDWKLGDWAIFNGTSWEKVDNTDAVVSVNGFTGAVSLTTSNISEGTNLYYTDARARAAISLTTTGSSGAATYSGGVINVPQYTLSGLGGVPTSRQLTINGTSYDLSADRTWTISIPVTSVSGSGAGISVSPTTGAVVISNTGVTSLNGSTGAITGIATTAQLANYLPLAGGTMTGDIIISGQRVKDLTATNKGVYIGNWYGAGYWGIGSASGTHELKLDQVDINGVWQSATDVNLYLGTRLVLNSSNYNSYSPTLTGGGASGTWGISISGTAAGETLATVTGRGSSTSTALTLNGTVTFTSAYSGGSGDWINITNPSFKVAPVSGYWRIPHTSNNASVSGVYNYETGKDVYWGEPTDSGSYYFRGRILRHENSSGTISTYLHSNNYNSYAPTLTGGGASGTWGISITGNSATTSQTNFSSLTVNSATVATQSWVTSQGYITSTNTDFTYNASLTLSTSWQDTGVTNSNLTTSGVYMITCYVNDFSVSGGQYQVTYTGTMYWFTGSTNNVNFSEIPLHHMGHADNDRYIYLRTRQTYSAGGTFLQIRGNGNNSGASTYTFTFKRLM